MSEPRSPKTWPGEPPGLWPAASPKPRDERRPDAERVEVVRKGFRIDHAHSRRVGPELTRFVERPWEPHQRWRGLLLVGPARSGRSWLVSRWLAEPYAHMRPVIVAHMPTDLAGDRVLRAVAEAGKTYATDYTSAEARTEALRRMGDARAVVFDSCDHLALLRKPRLLALLSKVKGVAEQRRVPVILVATPRLLESVASDPDWSSRFEVAHFPGWRMDRDFLDLLTAWEDVLPLREPSNLAERELALHLYSLCDGQIGRLGDVLREATLRAIDNAREHITIRLLDSLGFAPPSSFRGFAF